MKIKGLVSVCIPVYNGEKTIEETIESIINQTYSNIEIIVVDNCSSDNTVSIVNSINDSRIKLFTNDENLGMVGNWNKCLEYVSGEFFIILCADDIIDQNCIEKKLIPLIKNKNIVLSFGAAKIIDEKNNKLYSRHFFSRNCVFSGTDYAKKSFRRRNLYGEPSNVLVRSNAIDRVGMFSKDVIYATDWDYWIRISETGLVSYIDEELYCYRVASNNETSKIGIINILKNDKTFVESVRRHTNLDLNILDYLFHRFNVLIRSMARFCFMKMVSKGLIKG